MLRIDPVRLVPAKHVRKENGLFHPVISQYNQLLKMRAKNFACSTVKYSNHSI